MTATDDAALATGRCPVTGIGPREVSGPKGVPVLGVTPQLAKDPLDFTLALQRDHGEVARVDLVPRGYVQLTDPSAIERVLASNIANYVRGKLYLAFDVFMGRGLLTLDDAEWRAHRKVVQPAFTPERVAHGVDRALAALDDAFRSWDRAAREGRRVDLVRETMAFSGRLLGEVLVSEDLSRTEQRFTRSVASALEVIFKNVSSVEELLLPKWLPTGYQRRKKAARRVFDRIIGRVVAQRRAVGEDGDDVAGLIMKSDLSDQALTDNLVTMFLAGSETTGLSLMWALYELTRNPAVRREVEEEVDRVLAGAPPTFDRLDELPVTRSVVDETLRLYPSVWQFPRDAVQDDELAGRHVPAGTTVMVSVFGTHRNPALWENPNSFDPARFRVPAAQRQKFAYLPFGGGRRQCIGKPLAVAVLVAAVAAVCGRYRFALPYGGESVWPEAFITLFPPGFPAGGIPVEVSRRDG
ncbi:cytochrome P450 [Actinosynnema sp. NPDC023587]|uniref:cytochrome P450 n=1 Tax=Actinosynnema sp. NPDC023587 TaxID=3154695 RepID=UPI0033C2EEFA